MRNEIAGELSDRSRVIDHLLDLRQESGAYPELVLVVDRLLTDVPGLTIVPNAWWSTALDEFDHSVRKIAAGSFPLS